MTPIRHFEINWPLTNTEKCPKKVTKGENGDHLDKNSVSEICNKKLSNYKFLNLYESNCTEVEEMEKAESVEKEHPLTLDLEVESFDGPNKNEAIADDCLETLNVSQKVYDKSYEEAEEETFDKSIQKCEKSDHELSGKNDSVVGELDSENVIEDSANLENNGDDGKEPLKPSSVKVSKSRKQILKFSFEPKNKRKYFFISALAAKNP